MRIDRFLSLHNFCSRSETRRLLKTKSVLINNQVVTIAKEQVNVGDIVQVEDIAIEHKEFVYYLLNKPQDYVCANSDALHDTVFDLIDDIDFQTDLFSIGRLDIDTTGILILTNDGKLSHNLLAPTKHVPKTYLVDLAQPITDRALLRLRRGVLILEDYLTKPATVEVINEKQITLEIIEGKYHQVKEMLKAVDNEVVKLQRIKFNNLDLPADLEVGQYIEITKDQLL